MQTLRLERLQARFRQTYTANLTATCLIQRPTQISDGQGGWRSGSVQTGPFVCAYHAHTGSEQPRGGGAQLAAEDDGRLFLPAGTDVRSNDEVTVTLDGEPLVVLEILAVLHRNEDAAWAVTARVRELHPT